MSAWKRDSGQATVLTVLFLTVLLGMAALVLDVGSWFRADRKLQATADAAALAGAQALPEDPAQAGALALEYAGKNGGGVSAGGITFSSKRMANDTIKVAAEKPAPGIFAKLFGVDSVQVHATAAARAGNVSSARYVAPIVVNIKHPMLKCTPPPCTDPTEIELMNLHKPGGGDGAGAFGLINLDRRITGNPGSPIVGGWMADGFDRYMDLGTYNSVPSTMFNSSHFRDAMSLRLGDVVLFPIYRTLKESGSNAEYDVVGWVGFRISKYVGGGSEGKVYGSFTRVIWEGIQSQSPSQPDFGVRAIELVE